MELEPEPELFKSRNRNRNPKKYCSYGSTTLILSQRIDKIKPDESDPDVVQVLQLIAHLECIRPVPPGARHCRSPGDQGPAARPQPNQTP